MRDQRSLFANPESITPSPAWHHPGVRLALLLLYKVGYFQGMPDVAISSPT